jgi:ubiquinone/menaquinone biosynthesis C-methylase UbiE
VRSHEDATRSEFNEWARAGRAESMERGHSPVGELALALLDWPEDGSALDLGCGSGWAARRMARMMPLGSAVGMDVADEMIRLAGGAKEGNERVKYLVASAERLPFRPGSFTHVFSMESLYYYSSPEGAIKEVRRALRPGGVFCVVVDLFAENEPTSYWVSRLRVPVKFWRTQQYVEAFEAAGFVNVNTANLKDTRPMTDEYSSDWFRSFEEYKRYREIGSLVITGNA